MRSMFVRFLSHHQASLEKETGLLKSIYYVPPVTESASTETRELNRRLGYSFAERRYLGADILPIVYNMPWYALVSLESWRNSFPVESSIRVLRGISDIFIGSWMSWAAQYERKPKQGKLLNQNLHVVYNNVNSRFECCSVWKKVTR